MVPAVRLPEVARLSERRAPGEAPAPPISSCCCCCCCCCIMLGLTGGRRLLPPLLELRRRLPPEGPRAGPLVGAAFVDTEPGR